jgi:hypothetical protein
MSPNNRLIGTYGLIAASVGTILLVWTAAFAGEANPPAPGFDLEGSDRQAIEVADRVMERLGGRTAWDETRYLTWSFFGRRRHLWDKLSGDIRVEGVGRDDERPFLILMNLHTKRGKAWRDGQEITDPEELAAMLDRGEAVWINDSYWMFMPYKLKDTGVTLKYLGESPMQDGRAAEALELTFRAVGRTPQNKYRVYVAEDSGLVEQWDFFAEADDAEPRFTSPWHNWRRYGRILLSDDRGERSHTDIAVLDEVPPGALTSPAPVDWSKLAE